MIFAVAPCHLLSESESNDLEGRGTGLRSDYSVIQTGRPRADPVAVSEPLQGRCCFQHRAHTVLRKRLYPRHPCHIADLKLSVMISTEGLAIPRSPLASGIPAHELPLALSPLRDPPQIRKEQSRFWK